MSRQIDMSDPESWTEDEVRYLSDRGRLPEGFTVKDEPGAIPDEPDVVAVLGYDGMTKAQLASALKERDLRATGTKAEMIGRLEADDADLIVEDVD